MADRDKDGRDKVPAPTVIRPIPGAGRPGGYSGPDRSEAPGPRAPAQPSAIAGRVGRLEEFVAVQRNPLLQWAASLLVLGDQLRTSSGPADLDELRRQCIDHVQRFEAQLRRIEIAADDVVRASYALCTYVDTAVNSTPWGSKRGWFNQSLCLTLHEEVDGGKRFFLIVDQALADMARNIDLAELLYACLALGYEGKWRGAPQSSERLGDTQSRLYRAIAAQRGEMAPPLSVRWQGAAKPGSPALRSIPLWIWVTGVVSLWVGCWITLHLALVHQAEPVQRDLLSEEPRITYSDPTPPKRLKILLADSESRGELQVEDFGNRSVITLNAPGLFPSGSAELAPGFGHAFDQIATALRALPGRVVVWGHTDDQALRSIRFVDNFELSSERARAVAQLLMRLIPRDSGIESRGAGSTQPRYLPADAASNRPRNRRVEIVYYEAGEPT